MAILERPTELSPAATDEIVTRSLAERLPILGLAVLACLSVGYGFGTLNQFDHDWRDEPPVLVATVEGPVAQGMAIDQAIEELLARLAHTGLLRPVPEAVDVVGGEQLCRAATVRDGRSILRLRIPGPPEPAGVRHA